MNPSDTPLHKQSLFKRIFGFISPHKDNPKLAQTEMIMNAILLIGGMRVYAAVLELSKNFVFPLNHVLSLASLALTEGAFVVWRNARYHPKTNVSQKQVALGLMGITFLASLTIGFVEFLGAAIGSNPLPIPGIRITGYEVQVIVVAVALFFALFANVIGAFLMTEMDDKFADDQAKASDEKDADDMLRQNQATLRKADLAVNNVVSKVEAATRAISMLSVAPQAGVEKALERVRREMLDGYAGLLPEDELNRRLRSISDGLNQNGGETYAALARQYLRENADALGIDPVRAGDLVAEILSGRAKPGKVIDAIARPAEPSLPPAYAADTPAVKEEAVHPI
jgi:hypothetical protein